MCTSILSEHYRREVAKNKQERREALRGGKKEEIIERMRERDIYTYRDRWIDTLID